MNKIIYNLVFNRRKTLNNRGMALVQVEAYLDKKKKYFSTKIYLTPEQWDDKRKMVKNHPNAEALNRMLYEYIVSIEKVELSIWQSGKTVSLEMLKELLSSKSHEMSFTAFLYDEIIHSALKDSTKKNHLSTLVLLKQYKKEIYFSELTFEFLVAFERFMRTKGYHINTIAKHMKHLKRYINVAINKEYIEYHKYAFRKYKIKHVDNNHTHLSPEELMLLESLELKGKHGKLQKSLDAFLFCCYTGLRYSDFISLNAHNIVVMNQQVWLIYRSIKTKIEVRLPLYLLFGGKGLEILRKYMGNLNDFFNLKNNSNINKELLILSKLAGIEKHISFHTARHTNATLLIYNGANITTVQKILGHKSVKTTQIYSNIMDMTIVRDLEKIEVM